MAGFTSQGATFTFSGSRGNFAGSVVAVSVDTPVAEVVDMTSPTDPSGFAVLVPTGEWSGGTISVDYIASITTGDVASIVRGVGPLTLSSPHYSVTKRVILESARQDARVGDIVRGTMNFRMTDYQGT